MSLLARPEKAVLGLTRIDNCHIRIQLKSVNMAMRILGIDPGSRTTGYGIVEIQDDHMVHIASGTIALSPKEPFPTRLAKIYDSLETIIKGSSLYEVAMEDTFYARNVKSLMRLGEVRGVIFLAISKAGLAIHEYSPLSIKKSVAGFGMATKGQVQHMVESLLGLNAIAEHNISDALAVAICHIHSTRRF